MAIQDGTYRARAVGAALGETKGGKEQVAVEFELLTDDLTPGQRITWFGYFTEKTTARTIESLRICGWTGSDLTDLEGIGANEVELVVENEEWEGKTRAKVQWVNKAGGGLSLAAPLSADKAKAFAARMKGAVLAFDQAAGQPRKPAPKKVNVTIGSVSPTPPPHTDDDLGVFDDDKPPF